MAPPGAAGELVVAAVKADREVSAAGDRVARHQRREQVAVAERAMDAGHDDPCRRARAAELLREPDHAIVGARLHRRAYAIRRGAGERIGEDVAGSGLAIGRRDERPDGKSGREPAGQLRRAEDRRRLWFVEKIRVETRPRPTANAARIDIGRAAPAEKL